MLNKEQMFLVYEFINKNATNKVWHVSEDIIKMATELVKADQKTPNNELNKEICASK
jgi:hypothetical protein